MLSSLRLRIRRVVVACPAAKSEHCIITVGPSSLQSGTAPMPRDRDIVKSWRVAVTDQGLQTSSLCCPGLLYTLQSGTFYVKQLGERDGY